MTVHRKLQLYNKLITMGSPGYQTNLTMEDGVTRALETINGTLAAVAAVASTAQNEDDHETRKVPLLKQTLPVTVLLSVAYSVVFLLAVVNNSLVVTIIYRNPQMRNVTNYFLANLAIADITVSLLVLPITLLSNIFTGKFPCLPHLTSH